jgi:hypothetical protein
LSRAINLAMSGKAVRQHCDEHSVGISSIEELSSGGVRLVCMSGDGAAQVRRSLKAKLIEGDTVRTRIRPAVGSR